MARGTRRRLSGRLRHLTETVFVERRRLSEPVAVEFDRPSAVRPRVTGFWRGSAFYRVLFVADRRYERGETSYRVLTDRGAFDLCRARVGDRRTLRSRTRWELVAELDVLDGRRA